MFQKLLISFLLVTSTLIVDAQTISKAIFRVSRDYKSLKSIKIVIDKNIFIIENDAIVVPDRLDFNGTITYYDNFDGRDKSGKIKSIGNTNFNYYDNFDGPQRAGKLKSIGSITLNYYDQFDREEKSGKIKSIGGIMVNYYDVFDGTFRTGKVKSVGPVTISYFDNFDSATRSGQIKSIQGNTEKVIVNASSIQDDSNGPGFPRGGNDGAENFRAEKREIAHILKRRGVSLEIISEATDFSIQELKAL